MHLHTPDDHIHAGAKESGSAATPAGMSGSAAGSGAVTSGRLQFVSGVANASLQVASPLAGLYRAKFRGVWPAEWVDGGIVTLTYPRGFDPSTWSQAEAAITMNGALPWEIEFDSVSKVNAALSGLQLRALDVTRSLNGGCVTLPLPTGVVYVRIAENVSHLHLQCPVSVAVRIVVRQTVTALTFDDQHVAAVADGLSLATKDYHQTDNRYDIDVAGKASHLTITTETS